MNDPKYNPGQPQFGQPQFGQPLFGQPLFGQPPAGQPSAGQPGSPPAGERMSSIERAVRAFDRQEFVPPSSPGDMLPHALNPGGYGAPQDQPVFGQPPMNQAPYNQQPMGAAPASWQVQPGQQPYGAPPQGASPSLMAGQLQSGQPQSGQTFPGQAYPGQPVAAPVPPAGPAGMNSAGAPYAQPAGAPFGRSAQPASAPYGQAAPGQPPQGPMARGPVPSFAPPPAGMVATPGFPGLSDRGQGYAGAGYPGAGPSAHGSSPQGSYRGPDAGQHGGYGQQGYPAAPSQAAPPAGASRPISQPHSYYPIDRRRLSDLGMLGTEAASPGQVEEFRIVKRQIIEQADDMRRRGGGGAAQRVMVCSAHAGEGKTFCAVNLAMSLSAEKESEVLLVDFDLARASVLHLLGLPPGPGLMEAIVDHTVDVRKLVMATDIPGLSVLPGGRPTNSDTEYLASSRAAAVLDQLTEDSPQRIVLFDSPPALAASIPAELAKLMGQVVLVVLADSTSSGAIQDAASLLAGCPNVQLLLNSVQFSPNGRRFGSYHGYRG